MRQQCVSSILLWPGLLAMKTADKARSCAKLVEANIASMFWPSSRVPPHALQVVKVWNSRGEQQGKQLRAHTSLLDAGRIGPVAALAFHPYKLQLASGGRDHVAVLIQLEAVSHTLQ